MNRDAYEALKNYSPRRTLQLEVPVVALLIDLVPDEFERKTLIDKCKEALDKEDALQHNEVKPTDT